MKELNIKNYQAWVLEAFDLDKVVVDCGVIRREMEPYAPLLLLFLEL